MSRAALVSLVLAACRPAAPAATAPPAAAPTAAAPAVAVSTRLAREELLPGEAFIDISTETFDTPAGPLPGWSYVTEGLAGLGMPEVELLIVRRASQDASEFPREFIPVLGQYIKLLRGRAPLLQGMASVVLDEHPPLIAGTELRAITFMRFDASTTTPRPDGRLTALFMTLDEYKATMSLGHVRWAARLGRRAEVFPTSPWIDPAREPLLAQSELKQSILGEIPSRYLVGTSAVRHAKPGERVRISLEIGTVAAAAFKALAVEPFAVNGFALLTGLSPRADAYFLWRPDQREPEGIAFGETGGDNLGGNYLAFMTMPTAKDEARTVEDGFVVVLSPASWTRVQAAIRDGAPLELPLGDVTFTLAWPAS